MRNDYSTYHILAKFMEKPQEKNNASRPARRAAFAKLMVIANCKRDIIAVQLKRLRLDLYIILVS